MGSQQDERFSKVFSDSRFRTFRKTDKKTKIDNRFKSMFTDDKFKLQYSMDKRGRSKKHVIAENYKKFYSLEEEEKAKKTKKDKIISDEEVEVNNLNSDADDEEEENEENEDDQDDSNDEEGDEGNHPLPDAEETDVPKELAHKFGYHRGAISNDDHENDDNSSSSSSSDSEEENEEEDLEHEWGELDKEAPRIEEATTRLAMCNADWDKITAQDLYLLLNSFKPATGSIHYVRIYYSKFGLERLDVEEVKGPSEFIFGKSIPIEQIEEDKLVEDKDDENDNQEKDDNYNKQNDDDERENKDFSKDEDEDEDDEDVIDSKTTEKFRKYQFERLKYFYAVAEFDSKQTAETIYNELDGLEYESSATTLDIRFVPEEMDFEEEKLKEECLSMPSSTAYQPPTFVNTALQQSKVRLTWDETDHKRKATFEKAFEEDHEDDLKAYIASSSDDEDLDDKLFEKNNGLEDSEKITKYKELLKMFDNKKDEFEMEVTWDPNLKTTTEDLIHHKDPYAEKKSKRKSKEIGGVPSDVDSESNRSSEEEAGNSKDFESPKNKQSSKKWKNKKRKHLDQEIKVDSDLDLLMLEVDQKDKDKKHFSYKNIVEDYSKKKSKKMQSTKDESDGFKFDVDDPRFGAIFTSHHFNIDQSDPNFKKTEAFEKILNRRKKESNLDR